MGRATVSIPMLSAYFVSDVHVRSPDSERATLLTSFLKTLSGRSNTTHLFLLGDIFDLWVADHRFFIERYQPIIDEIRRLNEEDVEIRYFEGNHDLHLRYFWGERLGLAIEEGPCYVELGGRTVRLEHGDQMDPDDTGYLFLRWFLRTAPIRLLTRNLPGAVIGRMGERASATSREYTSHRKSISPAGAIEKIRAHARKAYAEQPFDLIISGHVHVRDDARIDTGNGVFRSVNLGSWFDAPCYFVIDDNGEHLVELTQANAQQPAARPQRRPATAG